MKFRIVKYYDRYEAQVLDENGKYTHIGSPTGYATIDDARNCCKVYKEISDKKIVEEFEL